MKNTAKALIITMTLVAFSCNSKKKALQNTDPTVAIQPICPEDGKCSTQLFSDKRLEVKTDEFGSVYYQLSDSNQTSVIVYQYKRNVEKGLQDGHYTEEIIFEINNSDTSISLSDLGLQQTKMLFGRLCFCRGQTGYYKITDGNLKLEQKNKAIHFNLNFNITQVPQIINSIAVSIK